MTTAEVENLFPYQLEGAQWLSTKRFALLADEMGLGKTVQAISAADTLNAWRILVVCPAVARINWAREFKKWSILDRPVDVILKGLKRSGQKLAPNGSVVCSYDLVSAAYAKEGTLLDGPWDLLILDEAHYLKSPTANRTQAILGKRGLIHKAKRTWFITGTPAPNHPAELWTMLYTCSITKLTYEAFIERYCQSYESTHGRVISGANLSRTPELRELLSGIMLRRRKDEVMKQLPPITYGEMSVEASEVELDMCSSFVQYVFPNDRRQELKDRLALERELVDTVTHPGTPGIMDALAGISQSVSTLRRYTGLQKVKAAAELIDLELELKAYEKVVIFAIHADVISYLRDYLRKHKPVTLYGKTPPEKRQANIDKFQKTKHCKVFIGNIQACGTAITLTAAHNVVFVEQSFVPAENAQAAMRCHRIGQEKPVYVRFITLENSYDQRVASIVKRKMREFTSLFDGQTKVNQDINHQASTEFAPIE